MISENSSLVEGFDLKTKETGVLHNIYFLKELYGHLKIDSKKPLQLAITLPIQTIKSPISPKITTGVKRDGEEVKPIDFNKFNKLKIEMERKPLKLILKEFFKKDEAEKKKKKRKVYSPKRLKKTRSCSH